MESCLSSRLLNYLLKNPRKLSPLPIVSKFGSLTLSSYVMATFLPCKLLNELFVIFRWFYSDSKGYVYRLDTLTP